MPKPRLRERHANQRSRPWIATPSTRTIATQASGSSTRSVGISAPNEFEKPARHRRARTSDRSDPSGASPSVFWFVGGTDPEVYAKAKQDNRLNELPVNHSPKFAPVIHPTLRTGSRGARHRNPSMAVGVTCHDRTRRVGSTECRDECRQHRLHTLAPGYQGDNKLVLGIVLAVVTFWLFAQTTLNIAPAMRDDLRIAESVNNIAVSITALFSGIFIVIAGGLADRLGRVKLTNIGIVLGILGSLLIALSPVGTATFLMIGRVIQGLSAACIMPSTLALMKAYFEGEAAPAGTEFLVHRVVGWFWSEPAFRWFRRLDHRVAMDLLHVHWCRSGESFPAPRHSGEQGRTDDSQILRLGGRHLHSSSPWSA